MNLLRLWNWAGGGLPLGPGLLLAGLLFWTVLLLLVVRPTGALRGRIGRWLGWGWLILLAVHVALRARLTPLQDTGLLLWPPEEPCAAGEGIFVRAEQGLREAGRAGRLRWDGAAPRLLITQHLLSGGRFQPADAAQADPLMRDLRLAWLVNLTSRQGVPILCLWRRSWAVCELADEEVCRLAARPDSLGAALERLLARHAQGWIPAREAWHEAWLPLYQPVADSARTLASLPAGPLPPWEDLRRTDLLRALGGDPAEVVAGVNRALALGEQAEGPAEAWLTAGFWYAQHGRWQETQQALQNARAREPEHPLISWQVAHLSRARLGEFGFALPGEARARSLELMPLFVPAVLAQAPDWMARRRGGLATGAVETALRAYPRQAELHLLRGNLAYQLAEHRQAVASYQACAALLPRDHRPWLNLGQLYFVLKEWDKGRTALEQALARGAPPVALYLVGYCQLRLGRTADAAASFERRLALGGSAEDLDLARRQLDKVRAALSPPRPDDRP